VVLDTHGQTTGALLLAVALVAAGLGFAFEARSAWCSGLCPVYPVEMLYGTRPLVTVRNAHCRTCGACVAPCRDSTPGAIPQDAAGSAFGRWSALVLVGGFPGFIIGWYQVPTWQRTEGLRSLAEAYAWPWGGTLASLLLYAVLGRAFPGAGRRLTSFFAAAAVASYYWFKLPVMLGLGAPGSALVDLGAVLPGWSIWLMRAGEMAFFASLLLLRQPRMWEIQPPVRLVRT
jgi:hypothetical protein